MTMIWHKSRIWAHFSIWTGRARGQTTIPVISGCLIYWLLYHYMQTDVQLVRGKKHTLDKRIMEWMYPLVMPVWNGPNSENAGKQQSSNYCTQMQFYNWLTCLFLLSLSKLQLFTTVAVSFNITISIHQCLYCSLSCIVPGLELGGNICCWAQ